MNINRVYFAGNHTAEPEVNYSPKGTAVVSASIANNELYGGAGSGVGRISYALCEFTGKH
jgi:single-stranded DNA-binding protein